MNNHIDSFLWSQGASSTEDSWFIIDGKISKYCRSQEQLEAMSWMTNTQFKTVAKHKKDDDTSLSFEIKTCNNAIQLAGNFMEKDESGRQLVFVLTTKKRPIENIVFTLRQYAGMLNLTLNENDINAYRAFFHRTKKTITVSCLILGVLFLLLLMTKC